MESYPLISVIITTYNRKENLFGALKSVYSQTYKNFEIIIIDDCSEDNIEEILKSNFKDYIYFRNEERMGVSFSRNRGLKIARGDFISFLDDDDCFVEDKLEIQLNTLFSLKKESFLFCNDFSIRGNKIGWDENIKSGFIHFEKDKFYLRKSFPPPSTWFLSRNIVSKVGYFDESLVVYEDLDYLVRILEFFPAYYLNKVLVKSGFSAEHLSSLSVDNIIAKERFLQKHFDKIKKDKYYLYRFYYNLGKDCLKINLKDDTRRYYLSALKIKPYKIELFIKFIKTYL